MELKTITREPTVRTHQTPLLFVHGMWHGAWCFDEYFLPFFAEQGYQVTAVSLRGHSGSGGKTFGSNVADYVRDVEQIAKSFSTPPVVVGHSLGGFVVQKYLENNAAPAGVLLSSVPPAGAWPATLRVFWHSPWNFVKLLFQLRLWPAVQKPRDARWALFSESMPEETFARFHAQLEDESFLAFLDLLGLNLVNTKKVSAPLLVLGGADDHIMSVNNFHRTAKLYGTQAQIFPKMAHDLMLEAGWKNVAQHTLGWLKERGL